MSKIFRNITMVYIIYLAALFGASVYAGAVVAANTFNTDAIFKMHILSRYLEGMIMTKNFVALSYAVTFGVVFVALYEGYRYKMGERDYFAIVAAFLIIANGMLFSYYYIPFILQMQSYGEEATKTAAFIKMHTASEISFKIFSFALLVLLVRNLNRALR